MLYGARPHLIAVRRSRLTYGVRCSRDYKKGDSVSAAHPASLDCRTGKLVTRDHFLALVRTEDEVPAGKVATHQFWPEGPGQMRAVIELFGSERREVGSVREVGVRRVAQVVVDLSKMRGRGEDVSRVCIEVQLEFGASELRLLAVNMRSGERVAAEVEYDHQ